MPVQSKLRAPKSHPLSALPETLSAIELGRLLFVSSRVVYDLARRGIVKRADQPGRYLTRASFDGYVDHLRETAAARGGADGTPNLAEERAETERIVRAREKIKLNRELDLVINRAEAAATWSGLEQLFAKGIDQAGSRIVSVLPKLTATDRATVDQLLGEVLIDLAQEMEGDYPPGHPLASQHRRTPV